MAMRKMGDSGSQTLKNCPLARRAWASYQGIHMQRDLTARLGGVRAEDTASADRRSVYTAVPSTPGIRTQGVGLAEARDRGPEGFL